MWCGNMRQGGWRAILYGQGWAILWELQRKMGVSGPLFAGLDELDGLDEVAEVNEPISPPSTRPARKGKPKTAGPGRR